MDSPAARVVGTKFFIIPKSEKTLFLQSENGFSLARFKEIDVSGSPFYFAGFTKTSSNSILKVSIIPNGGINVNTVPLLDKFQVLAPFEEKGFFRIMGQHAGKRYAQWYSKTVPSSHTKTIYQNVFFNSDSALNADQILQVHYIGDPRQGALRFSMLNGDYLDVDSNPHCSACKTTDGGVFVQTSARHFSTFQIAPYQAGLWMFSVIDRDGIPLAKPLFMYTTNTVMDGLGWALAASSFKSFFIIEIVSASDVAKFKS